MRLKKPRILPLTGDDVAPALAESFPDGPGRNVVATFAHHLELVMKWGLISDNYFCRTNDN